MLGRSTLWMPRFICDRSISRDFSTLLTAKLGPVLHWAERFLQPRMSVLLHPVPERIVGAACLLLAVILFLPIPFGNIPPALAIAAFALGILERDGVATLVGWLAAIGSLLILGAISSAIRSQHASCQRTIDPPGEVPWAPDTPCLNSVSPSFSSA